MTAGHRLSTSDSQAPLAATHRTLCLHERLRNVPGPHATHRRAIGIRSTSRSTASMTSSAPSITERSRSRSMPPASGQGAYGMSARLMATCGLSCWKCHVRSRLWTMGTEGRRAATDPCRRLDLATVPASAGEVSWGSYLYRSCRLYTGPFQPNWALRRDLHSDRCLLQHSAAPFADGGIQSCRAP
jgi:hypothetical protein